MNNEQNELNEQNEENKAEIMIDPNCGDLYQVRGRDFSIQASLSGLRAMRDACHKVIERDNREACAAELRAASTKFEESADSWRKAQKRWCLATAKHQEAMKGVK